jgi:hypothetical protein
LEDSERTRLACARYLQNRPFYFYPEKIEIANEAGDLVRSLEGDLALPETSFEFFLAGKIFDWRTAKLIGKMRLKEPSL